ncbi:SixA phosphatase family protein [Leeuwenhoekiella parthenopeia]|uniref:Histidine phosphatase family protein n=1 Tax=Leeuwenhoekiella parthenopeia TaxID=2890320 RepID=A0ABS8GU74_9FLAO|nr:histidine phosphatase family protein [Leeuwenhoekiella parthenopeia]MCC4213341.1 histidine phosphatase family protein [Leeuwenhoekiella parthenopeia]
MKTIYLVRHAKSSWEYELEDHQRPLNDRGLHDAPLMGAYIRERIELPQLVLSSDAVRAKTTAMLYLKELGIPEEELKLDNRLYDFGGTRLDKVIKSCDDGVDRLMVFGHNNALTYWVNRYGDLEIENVSTAAFTAIQFKAKSWSDISNGKTILYVKPKQLK